MIHPRPTPEAQLQFLAKLQRVFAEGDFAATYKFALLIALADLAVEHGADDGAPLTLTTQQIGRRFVDLYWQHALPYGTGRPGTEAGILLQNNGAQAAVVSAIAKFRAETQASTLRAATAQPHFKRLVGTVTATVSAQPLNFMQNFGGGTDEFLYERVGSDAIRLKPGGAYCLRRFYPLVHQLARSHWVGHIKANQRNTAILGETDDLESFLFTTARQSLEPVGQALRQLQCDRCFYCGRSLNAAADVDHYIPFSLYPRDLVHNLVLAHRACNRSKSDTLAALPHLERWLERTQQHGAALTDIGAQAGIAADAQLTWRVGAWAYANAHACGSKAWVKTNQYSPVDGQYTAFFDGLAYAQTC